MGSFADCVIASTKLENLSNNGISLEGTDSRTSFEGPECVFQWHLLFIVGTVDLSFFEGSAMNGQLSCGLPCLVALGIFGALTKLKLAANDLPYTSQVVLGLFGQCNAQASKVAHCVPRCSCDVVCFL